MKVKTMKRAMALLLVLVMALAMCCTVAFAAPGTSGTSGTSDTSDAGGDIFSNASSLLVNIRDKILGISTAVCGVFLVIAACMWGFGNKQQSAAGWEWMKRIIIAYIAINSITIILSTIDNLSGIKH